MSRTFIFHKNNNVKSYLQIVKIKYCSINNEVKSFFIKYVFIDFSKSV